LNLLCIEHESRSHWVDTTFECIKKHSDAYRGASQLESISNAQ
jgi:hypothetical protein